MKLNIGFLEQIYLRGIEGMISDKALAKALEAEVPGQSGQFMEALDAHMNAKHIAEQVFFQMKGWGLR